MIEFQDSEVFRAALELHTLAAEIAVDSLTKPYQEACRRLQNGAEIVLVDIAEDADGDSFSGTLRGDVFVCAAMVDVCRRGGVEAARCDQMQAHIDLLATMLAPPPKDAKMRFTGRLNC